MEFGILPVARVPSRVGGVYCGVVVTPLGYIRIVLKGLWVRSKISY